VLTLQLGSIEGAVVAISVLGLAVAAGSVIRQLSSSEDAATRSVTPAAAGSAPAGEWTNPHELTPREVEVLGMIAAGRSNQEIADGLHISMATVKTHVNHVFGKTGVRDRAQAVAYAYERGLVGAPPQG
jgi:DNA-binding NarL/FixJ family response regulator